MLVDRIDDGLTGYLLVKAAEVAAVDMDMVCDQLQIQVPVVMLLYILLAFDDDVIGPLVIKRHCPGAA
ncbi:hypothetical protein D3C75_1104690 [compost metagenome]